MKHSKTLLAALTVAGLAAASLAQPAPSDDLFGGLPAKLPPVASGPAATAPAKPATDAAPASRPGVVRLVRAGIRDPMSNNMVATTLLTPVGWQVDGGVVWRWNPDGAVTHNVRIFDPKGPDQVRYYPNQLFFDGVRESVAQTAAVAGPQAVELAVAKWPDGSFYGGCEVRRRIADPFDATRQIMLERFRPELLKLKPTAVGELPDVAKSLAEQGGGRAAGLEVRVVRLRWEYDVDGAAVEEEMRCVAAARPVGPFLHWTLDARTYRAAKGKLDAAMPMLFAIDRSAKADLKWYAGVVHVQQMMRDAANQQIADAGRLSAYIAKRSDEVNALIRGSYRDAQRANDKAMDAYGQTIRGVEHYADPSDREARWDLPAGYDHAYFGPRGEVILSNDPNYNPAVALQEDWKEMQKAP